MSVKNMQILQKPKIDDSPFLQLCPINVNDDYVKKWNINLYDFVVLAKNGELIRDTLYRVGGLNYPNPEKDKYFMLLKHVEAFYSKDIIGRSKNKNPRHLESRWCIIDKDGNEKVEFKPFTYPYLIKDSLIYSIDNNYYNIETGELYCQSYSSMNSSAFIFLENRFDKDESRRGVMKINKKDGTWELFS